MHSGGGTQQLHDTDFSACCRWLLWDDPLPQLTCACWFWLHPSGVHCKIYY